MSATVWSAVADSPKKRPVKMPSPRPIRIQADRLSRGSLSTASMILRWLPAWRRCEEASPRPAGVVSARNQPRVPRLQPRLLPQVEVVLGCGMGSPAGTRPVLVTGATGYIGGRLVPRLLEAGHRVRCLAREPRKLDGRPWAGDPRVEVVAGDTSDVASLRRALEGCGAAFYLVHSMVAAGHEYAERDRAMAKAFARAAEDTGLERIVYLGGLGELGAGLSEHLASRREVEELLASGQTPVTVLRAAMIIGSGSASFEILRYLVERLPVMVTPRWVTHGVAADRGAQRRAVPRGLPGRPGDGGPHARHRRARRPLLPRAHADHGRGARPAPALRGPGAGADAPAELALDPPRDPDLAPHRPAPRRGPAQPRRVPERRGPAPHAAGAPDRARGDPRRARPRRPRRRRDELVDGGPDPRRPRLGGGNRLHGPPLARGRGAARGGLARGRAHRRRPRLVRGGRALAAAGVDGPARGRPRPAGAAGAIPTRSATARRSTSGG